MYRMFPGSTLMHKLVTHSYNLSCSSEIDGVPSCMCCIYMYMESEAFDPLSQKKLSPMNVTQLLCVT